ncbi:MAG: hypothetical protein RIC55_21885 [Pirellulaceae bacterium]
MNIVVLPLLLAAHLMCMNVASAGPLVCLWLEWKEQRGDKLAGRAGRYLAGSGVVLLLVGVLWGLGLGAVLWNDAYLAAIKHVRSRVEFGVAELVFSLALMVAHYVWWRMRPECSAIERWLRMALPLAAGTNTLYHFPPLFVILSQLSAAAGPLGEPMTSAEFRARLLDGEVLARSLHFVLAAFAMCGVMLIGYALRLGRQGAKDDEVQRAAVWGGWLALVPTVAQALVGLWVLLSFPEPVKMALMGQDLAATFLLGLSIISALGLMHQLAVVAFGEMQRRALVRAMVSMVVVVTLMCFTVERIRNIPRPPPQPNAAQAKAA